MVLSSSKEVPEEAVKAMESNWGNKEFVDSVVRASEILGPIPNVVHANGHPTIYSLASQGVVALFYSPKPVMPKLISEDSVVAYTDNVFDAIEMRENPFEAQAAKRHFELSNLGQLVRRISGRPHEYYFVPPEKALTVGEMIRDRKPPQEIVWYLGLENRVTSRNGMTAKIQQNYGITKP